MLSQSWKEYFASIGMDKDKLHVLNNIVSPPEMVPDKHTEDGKLHLMYMGEISKRKGGFDLLKAIADNKEFLPINFYFVWEVMRLMVTSRLIFVRMAWNTKAIADAIKFYIENRDAIRKQGNNAFNVVQDFFPEKVFGDLKALYLEMFK